MKRTDPLALALACITLQAVASADLITWGPVQNITSSAEVSTNGTSVAAYNTWASTVTSPTVSGIFFSAYAPPGWDNGGWSLLAGSTTGDGEYDDLLDSARATSESPVTNPTGWGGIRLDTVATLTPGNVYEIQVWYSDQRAGTATNVLPDRVMTLSSATGLAALSTGIVTNLASLTQGSVSGGLDADPNNMSGAGDTAIGSYAIGTFTRTTSEELWLLIQGTHPIASNNLRPHINAFQIRDVTNAGFVSVAAGETWSFQAWHRDSSGGAPTSNFTDGLAVTFN